MFGGRRVLRKEGPDLSDSHLGTICGSPIFRSLHGDAVRGGVVSRMCRDLRYIYECLADGGGCGGCDMERGEEYTSSHAGVRCENCYGYGHRDFCFIDNDEGDLVCAACALVTAGDLSVCGSMLYMQDGPIVGEDCAVVKDVMRHVFSLCEQACLGRDCVSSARRVLLRCKGVLMRRGSWDLPKPLGCFAKSLVLYVTQSVFVSPGGL